MPGAGKSTIGVLLARALGNNFLDTDTVLRQREGAPLQELVDLRGTEQFLDAEAEAVCSVTCCGQVIATGGSVVCRPAAMAHLKALGTIVYLHVPYQALEQRIRNLGSRGIAFQPGQTLADLYQERAPLYTQYADLTVEIDGLTPEQTVAEIVRVLPDN